MKRFTILLYTILSFTAPTVNAQDCDRKALVEWYTSHIGVQEATGTNDGDIIESWQALGEMNKVPWCGAFYIAGYVYSGIDLPNAPKYYFYTPNIAKTGKKVYAQGKSYDTVLPGDAILIYNSKLNRIAHVGAVFDWQGSNSQVISIEGNTNEAGSREGNIVAVRIRHKDQLYQVQNILK